MLLLVRDHRVLQRYTYTAMLVGLLLLILPLLPFIGAEINGARIWVRLDLGARTFSFQPAEVAKIVLIVFFAGYLVVKRDVLALARSRVMGIDLPRGRDLGPILVAWAASLGVLVFQRDLGTSLLFFGLFVAMLYIATERRSWIIIGGFLFAAGALVAYQLFDHVQLRVGIWLNPFADETGDGFQIAQSLYGFASGGVLGVGLGQGHPDFVPFAKTDFIMAAFGEELGLTGVMALLALYADRDRTRHAHRRRLPRPVRQAARRRSVDRPRHPGVRRRRRCHEADPADRSHHPVPVLRRFVAGRELGARRPAAAGQRRRAASSGGRAAARWRHERHHPAHRRSPSAS